MQHFLFVVYYSQSIVAYDLQPRATAEFTRKLKCGYNHEHTILTIGSSYADLLYQDHSDISLSISADPNCPGDNPWTSSDLLTDIRAQSTAKLKEII